MTGKARGVPAEANFDYGTWRGVFSVSRDGILVYQTAQEQARGQLQWMDPSGRVGERVGEPNNSYALRLSPDGTRASVIEGDPNSDLWVYELDRGLRTRLTTNEQVILTPIWARDGAEIFYVSGTSATVGSDYKLLRRSAFGGGKVAEVARSKVRIEPTDRSPDGRYLVVDRGAIGTHGNLAVPLDQPDKPARLMETPGLRDGWTGFPDGRWLAFTQLQGGRLEAFVIAFPGGDRPSAGIRGRWKPRALVAGRPHALLRLTGQRADVRGGRARRGTGCASEPPNRCFPSSSSRDRGSRARSRSLATANVFS